MNGMSQDDLQDVLELTRSIELSVFELLKEQDLDIAISSLISACVNSIVSQCDTIEDILFYRKIAMLVFDQTIRRIRVLGD